MRDKGDDDDDDDAFFHEDSVSASGSGDDKLAFVPSCQRLRGSLEDVEDADAADDVDESWEKAECVLENLQDDPKVRQSDAGWRLGVLPRAAPVPWYNAAPDRAEIWPDNADIWRDDAEMVPYDAGMVPDDAESGALLPVVERCVNSFVK